MPRLWAFLAIALPVLAALIANLSSVDLTYHLRAGAEILAGRRDPDDRHVDVHGARRAWTDQQWGAQVILAAVYQVGSAGPGLVLLRAALVGVIFGCLFVIGRRRGLGARPCRAPDPRRVPRRRPWRSRSGRSCSGWRSSRSSCCSSPSAAPTRGRLWARAGHRRSSGRTSTAASSSGPLVLGLAWLEDLHDRVPAPGGRSPSASSASLAACLTPFGPAVWAYAVGLSTNPLVTERITEWQATSLRTCPGMLFFALGAGRRRADRPARPPDLVADARLARRSSSSSARTPSAASPGGRSAPWPPSPGRS